MIGSYVPRQCGIATFTRDLARALAEHVHRETLREEGSISIVALNDHNGDYAYGPEVLTEIAQHRREAYRNAAEVLNASKIEAVSLQHEYGLFGGQDGDYVFELLDRLRKPVVTTLHTILSEPTAGQRDVLQRICELSSGVVVMADRAVQMLRDIYGVPPERVWKIHHGVPDVPYGDTEPFKSRFDLSGRPTILTFGLLGPGKGIEVMLEALAQVVPDHPDLAYIVLGVTHPGEKRAAGESYRISLESLAVKLGIQRNVLFQNRYVSNSDLCEYLQAADIYVTPYRAKEQITSGTLAYALASGRAIISTPYWYAEELLAGERGVLVNFGDVAALARAVRDWLENVDRRNAIRKAAYDYGRQMIWAETAARYNEVFNTAVRTRSVERGESAGEGGVLLRMSLPESRMDHLIAMTDDTGLVQHAVFSVPDRTHGYSTDDNARALVVMAASWSVFGNESVLPHLKKYLSFLHYAKPAGGGRFRNFMSYDRRWFDHDGSDDCQGRVMWALGHLVSHSPSESVKLLATDLFRLGMTSIRTLMGPRPWALSVLGLYYFLREFPDDAEVRACGRKLAERLHDVFKSNHAEGWPWPENVVTYDNGRLPQALIMAGLMLDDSSMIESGVRTLEWLLEIQTGDDGVLSVIGNAGWYRKSGERARFDQQPLEPAALIGACKAAHRASGDAKWLVEMRRCFEWYLGRNDLGVTMVDFKTRGCFDGLRQDGVNHNEGAESVVSWLLALLTMHEMQTGDAPDAG